MNDNTSDTVDIQINKYLNENPRLKEALDVFSISNEEYKKAIESVTQKHTVTTFNTDNNYGNMARNS
jgi:F0F1-type ATP synthase delta subunit